MLKVNDLNRLYLGIQGENQMQTITIDVHDWLVGHPNGSISIWHKRNGDSVPAATGATLDREKEILSWSPTGTDTYVAGEGEAEIRLTENGVIKKSRTILTGVSPSVTGAGVPLGSGWQDYIGVVEGFKNGADQSAEDAEDSAEDAAASAEDAEAYAVGTRGGEDVDDDDPAYDNNAKYYAGEAGESASDAADSATDAAAAKTAAETAQGLAETAQAAAESARDAVLGMSATATGLEAGSNPTVSYSSGLMSFGIPKGDKGDKGDTGNTGAAGADGTNAYVHIKYAANQPTQDSDMKDTADEWMGIYSGSDSSAPTTYTSYTWYKIKGSNGDGAVSGIKMNGSSITLDQDGIANLGTVITDKSDKADKVSSPTSGNFAALDGNGNLTDSGHKHGDYVTDISGKADKVSSPTSGNFAALDGNGNLTDSGHKHSDYLTSHQDISGKADKVSSPTSGDFAGLDSNGNLTDSGKSASDFAAPASVASGTLAAGSWTSATPPTQTISVTGVTASNNIIVSIASTATSAQYEAAAAAKLLCTAQGAGEITVTCYGTEPTENIPLTVMIMG